MTDGNRRQILLLLKGRGKDSKRDIRELRLHSPALLHPPRGAEGGRPGLREEGGQKRCHSLNRNKMSEMVRLFDGFWDENLDRHKRRAEGKR